MKEGDERCDVQGQQKVNEAAIVIQTFLIDLPATVRQHPTPCGGETICVQVEFAHQCNVAFGVGVCIAGDVCILASANLFRRVCKHIPNRFAFAVCVWTAFDLKGGSGSAE
jgi:hypothetical protein